MQRTKRWKIIRVDEDVYEAIQARRDFIQNNTKPQAKRISMNQALRDLLRLSKRG